MPIEFTRAEFDELMRLDPVERAKRLTSMLAVAGTLQHRLSILRGQVIEQLRDEGWTLQQIADELGVTRQQIHRIAGAFDREEAQRIIPIKRPTNAKRGT